MARFEPSGFDEMEAQLRRMGEAAAPVVQEMLDAGAEVLKEAWRNTAERYKVRKTGHMIESIGVARGREDDPFREIYPQGKDPDTGVRNAEKAFTTHYGTSRIKARYWVDEAENAAQAPLNEAMQAVFDKRMQEQQGG